MIYRKIPIKSSNPQKLNTLLLSNTQAKEEVTHEVTFELTEYEVTLIKTFGILLKQCQQENPTLDDYFRTEGNYNKFIINL